MLSDDEVDVTCVYFLHSIFVYALCFYASFLSSLRLGYSCRGLNCSDLAFPPLEIHLGEVEGRIREGIVELGGKVAFRTLGFVAEGGMQEKEVPSE